jgi:Vps53-like, N-terminal
VRRCNFAVLQISVRTPLRFQSRKLQLDDLGAIVVADSLRPSTLRATMAALRREDEKSSLSSPEYDPLIHLNQIFPNPGSLSGLAAVQVHLSRHLTHLDREITRASAKQREQQAAAQGQIEQLQSELEDLFANVEGVRAKAEKADAVMGNLTGGIRRLDGGKRNLTTSMTALKRLQMLSRFPPQCLRRC